MPNTCGKKRDRAPVQSKFKMSDFDAFGDSNEQQPQVQEEDPAADFLAREQDELKGLEDDNFGEQIPDQTTQGNEVCSRCLGQRVHSPFFNFRFTMTHIRVEFNNARAR